MIAEANFRHNDINSFFEFNLAKVIRDVRQDNIPISSSIGQKSSNIFGSSKIGISKFLSLNYEDLLFRQQ